MLPGPNDGTSKLMKPAPALPPDPDISLRTCYKARTTPSSGIFFSIGPPPLPGLMNSQPLPYTLEDRTGLALSSDFDDIYDRLFLRVAKGQQQRDGSPTVIYNMNRRSSRHRDSLPLQREPSVILEFGANGALGNVTFMQRPAKISIPMNRYLRKTSIFGG